MGGRLSAIYANLVCCWKESINPHISNINLAARWMDDILIITDACHKASIIKTMTSFYQSGLEIEEKNETPTIFCGLKIYTKNH